MLLISYLYFLNSFEYSKMPHYSSNSKMQNNIFENQM